MQLVTCNKHHLVTIQEECPLCASEVAIRNLSLQASTHFQRANTIEDKFEEYKSFASQENARLARRAEMAEAERDDAIGLIRSRSSMQWVECDKQLPQKDGYYLVWIPAWEGYCEEDTFDVAFWDGNEWGELNAFAAIGDGSPVSHWLDVTPPPSNKQCSEGGEAGR